MNLGSIGNSFKGFESFFSSSEAEGAAIEAEAKLDSKKAEQIESNAESSCKKMDTEMELKKAENVNSIQVSF